jgi:hypothetical protein
VTRSPFPTLLHRVGEAADLLVQLAIGDPAVLARVVALPDDRDLVAAGGEVAVHAVRGDVERAVMEPADMQVAGVVGDVLHLRVGPDPVDPAAVLGPEADGILQGVRVHRLVLGGVDPGARGVLLRDGKEAPFRHGVSPSRLVRGPSGPVSRES